MVWRWIQALDSIELYGTLWLLLDSINFCFNIEKPCTREGIIAARV